MEKNSTQYLLWYGKRRWKGGKRKRAGISLISDRVDIAELPLTANERKWIGGWERRSRLWAKHVPCYSCGATSCFTLCGRTQTKCTNEAASVIDVLFDTITGRKGTLTLAVNLRLPPKSINAIPLMSFLQKHMQDGRFRRFWPKKFDMVTLSQKEIDNGVLLLNLTRRKVLKGLTLLEVFTGKRVALMGTLNNRRT